MNDSLKKITFTISTFSTLLFISLDISCAFAENHQAMAAASAKTFSLNLSPPCYKVTGKYCRTTASPLIENGLIYVRAFDEFIYVIDQKTAEITKKYNTESLSFFEPAMQDGILYASSWYMYAFDQETTNLKWRTGWAIDSTPVVYRDSIIFGERDGVTALNRWTGKEKWHVKYDNEYFSSPLIHNDNVLIGSYSPSNMHKTGFYSINAETGKEVWAFPIGYDYYAKPCAINNTIYVGANGNQFFAIDAATGLYEWTFKSKDSIFTRFSASPYCDVDKIYVGSSGSTAANLLYAFDSKTGNIAWTFRPSSDGDSSIYHDIMSSPNVHNNVIFVGCDDHYLYAVYKKTGKLKWKFKADAEIRSRPTIDKGVVYFTTLAGTLYAVNEKNGDVYNG